MADPSAESSSAQDGGLTADLPNQTEESPAPAFEDDDDGMFFGRPAGGTIGDGFGIDQSASSQPPASPPLPGSVLKKLDNGKPFGSSFFEQTFGGSPTTFGQQPFLSSDNAMGFHDDKHIKGSDDKGTVAEIKDVFYGMGKQKPVVYDADSVAEWMAGKAQRPVLGMSYHIDYFLLKKMSKS
jgi:hypothetical protein